MSIQNSSSAGLIYFSKFRPKFKVRIYPVWLFKTIIAVNRTVSIKFQVQNCFGGSVHNYSQRFRTMSNVC